MPSAEFIDFVDEHKRVRSTDTLERLDNFPGKSPIFLILVSVKTVILTKHSPNISSPVSFDLRDITQATNRETEKLSANSSGKRLANRGFTDSGGAM